MFHEQACPRQPSITFFKNIFIFKVISVTAKFHCGEWGNEVVGQFIRWVYMVIIFIDKNCSGSLHGAGVETGAGPGDDEGLVSFVRGPTYGFHFLGLTRPALSTTAPVSTS